MNPENPFAKAIELIEPGISSSALARRYRVAIASISRWRRGLRKPPQAIVERVQAELAESIRAHQEAAQALSAGIPHPQLGAAALRRWRAQRAKEKARD